MIFRLFRVPAVYLTWANPVFLAFFAFNGINNLRAFNVAFSSIPTAPTRIDAGWPLLAPVMNSRIVRAPYVTRRLRALSGPRAILPTGEVRP